MHVISETRSGWLPQNLSNKSIGGHVSRAPICKWWQEKDMSDVDDQRTPWPGVCRSQTTTALATMAHSLNVIMTWQGTWEAVLLTASNLIDARAESGQSARALVIVLLITRHWHLTVAQSTCGHLARVELTLNLYLAHYFAVRQAPSFDLFER